MSLNSKDRVTFYKTQRASQLGAVPTQCDVCAEFIFAEFMEDNQGLIALVCPNCKSVTSHSNN